MPQPGKLVLKLVLIISALIIVSTESNLMAVFPLLLREGYMYCYFQVIHLCRDS